MKIAQNWLSATRSFCSLTDHYPWTAFLLFACLHLVAWTLLPWAIFTNPFMDVVEGLIYGREWQLGYDKHPPLAWWLLNLTYKIFRTDKISFLLSQLSVLISLAIVFAAAKRIVPTLAAFASILILDGLHYFHFTGVKFNQDVLQLPIWALAGYAYWRALKDDLLRWWLLLAFALAAAFWCKYFAIVLAIPLVLFLLLDGEARKRLATPRPYFAAATFLFLLAPHLYWVWGHDFVTLRYIDVRAIESQSSLGYLKFPLQFAIWQCWYLLPVFAIATPLLHQRVSFPQEADSVRDFDRRIVSLLALGPAATLFVVSMISGRGVLPMWGYPLWMFLGIFIVLTVKTTIDCRMLARISLLWTICFTSFAIAFALNNTALLQYKRDQRAQTYFPGEQLAQEIADRYEAITGKPPSYVIGSIWVGGNVSHFTQGGPRLLIDAIPTRAPWIDIIDLKNKGAVIVWTGPSSDDGLGNATNVLPIQVARFASKAQVQKPFTLNYARGAGIAEVGWAILWPER